MWNIEDVNNFKIESENDRGQIMRDQEMGKIIYDLSCDSENQILVDIGTWNGLGSTRCFIEGMFNNKSAKLYTIENNIEMYEFAKNYWMEKLEDHNLDVNFICGSLVSNDEIDVFLNEKSVRLNEQQEYWLSIDKTNTQEIIDIIWEKIDVLLIDGSEFTGFSEMMKLKDLSKYIVLDDTRAIKNMYTREYLLNSPDFSLISENANYRNGYSLFKNKNL